MDGRREGEGRELEGGGEVGGGALPAVGGGAGAGAVPRRGRRRAKRVLRHYTPEQRREAVEAYLKSGLTQAMFARQWGVSHITLNFWIRQHRAGGGKALEGAASGGKRKRGRPRLAAPAQEAIVETRQRFPLFGLKKVRDFLKRFRGVRVSTGTVRNTLREKGIGPAPAAPRRRKRPSRKPQRFERAAPGALWQTDITYLDVPWRKQPLYLVAFLDDHSRYVVGHGLFTNQRQEIVLETLEEAIVRWGKPAEVLSDQGRQYFSWRGKSTFQKLLKREGIAHLVARAHHPQTVGKTERFWETLKRELWDRVMVKDLEEARARLSHFVAHYNHFRPHQSLEGLTPADRFFGASSEVRKTLEAAMDHNELLLALGQEARTPLFLVGQIGDQSVSIHGERGKVVVQTSDGERKEIEAKDLGMPSTGKEKTDEDRKGGPGAQQPEQRERDESGDDDEQAAGGAAPQPGAGGGPGPCGGAGAAEAAWDEAAQVPGAPAHRPAGAGAVGGGERGGEEEGARDGGGGADDVAGQEHA